MARGSEYDREQRAKGPNCDKKRAFAAKQRRVLAKQAEEQRKENRRQELAALQHVLAAQRLVAQHQRAVLAEEVLEVIAAEKSGGLNESASPASPAAGFPSPGSSISTASASPSHLCARSTPPSVLRSRVGELSKELDKAASEVARLEQDLEERQQRASQAEASKIARAGEVSLVASHLLQYRDLLQQMQEHAEAETLRADKAEAKIKVMAQRPASPSEKGPGPRARVPLLHDTEAQEQLSQCLAELAQEREAKEEAQEQLASLREISVQGPTRFVDSPAAMRAEDPAAYPAVQGPTRFVDSPAAMRAADPAAHRPALGRCLNANSVATLRAGELAKAKCPPPDTQSPSGRRL